MRNLVALDNHALVWGVRRRATPGQEEMIPRATALLQQLEEEHAQLIVPTPVIAEFLVRTALDEHDAVLAELSQRFILAPLDVAAARQAAVIYQETEAGDSALLKELQAEVGKQRIKVDIQILAIALTNGATRLYTEDSSLRKLAERVPSAQGRIKALCLPPAASADPSSPPTVPPAAEQPAPSTPSPSGAVLQLRGRRFNLEG